jgi:hypothetical protein
MDDLIAELAAENPLPTCKAPPIDALWRKLDVQAQEPLRTFAPVRWLAVATGAVVIPVLVAAVVLSSAHRNPQRAPAHPAASSCRLSSTAFRSPVHQAGVPSAQILSLIAVLRRPPGPRDRTQVACVAARAAVSSPFPGNDTYFVRADPRYVRYAGPGLFGGQMFLYALPGFPRRLAERTSRYMYSGMPRSARAEARELMQPTVCLKTIFAFTGAHGHGGSGPSGCFTLSKLRAPTPAFGAADGLNVEPSNVTGSLVAGVVPDGPNAIDVYRGHSLVGTAEVRDNVAVFHSKLGAAAAAHLRLVYVRRRQPLRNP